MGCPFMATILSTLRMFITYKRQQQHHQEALPDNIIQQKQAEERKLVQTICFIVIGYAICCLPFMVYVARTSYLVSRGNTLLRMFSMTRNTQGTLMLSNGIVDILVYSSMDEGFINYAKKVFTKHRSINAYSSERCSKETVEQLTQLV